jgi:hypothetical protein
MEGPMTALERDDIQGNVLRGYGFPRARYLVARVREPGPARRWLAARAVTTDCDWDAEPSPALNVALSFSGLRALGLPEYVLESFPEDFRAGMAARAARIGDAGEAAPECWQPGLRPGDIDVLVALAASDERVVSAAAARLRRDMAANGLEPGYEQGAALLDHGREHFGFTDGFGQPAIAGVARHATPGQGVPIRYRPWQRRRADVVRSATDRRLGWRALEPGEFVLGYQDEDGGPPPAPVAPFGRNGTFMVWRKSRRGSSGAGPTAVRSSCGPTAGTRTSAGTGAASTTSATRAIRTASRARAARTCAARTPATRWVVVGASPRATASCAAACRTATRCRTARPTTAPSAASCSSRCRPASSASSRSCRRGGATTATRSASDARRTRSPAP